MCCGRDFFLCCHAGEKQARGRPPGVNPEASCLPGQRIHMFMTPPASCLLRTALGRCQFVCRSKLPICMNMLREWLQSRAAAHARPLTPPYTPRAHTHTHTKKKGGKKGSPVVRTVRAVSMYHLIACLLVFGFLAVAHVRYWCALLDVCHSAATAVRTTYNRCIVLYDPPLLLVPYYCRPVT